MKRVTADDAARWISITWACWWVYFALAVGIGEGASPAQTAAQTLFAVILFLGSVWFAWRWTFSGGVLLILEGAVIAIAYSVFGAPSQISDAVAVTAVFALGGPPIAAGILFLQSAQLHSPNLKAQ